MNLARIGRIDDTARVRPGYLMGRPSQLRGRLPEAPQPRRRVRWPTGVVVGTDIQWKPGGKDVLSARYAHVARTPTAATSGRPRRQERTARRGAQRCPLPVGGTAQPTGADEQTPGFL